MYNVSKGTHMINKYYENIVFVGLGILKDQKEELLCPMSKKNILSAK